MKALKILSVIVCFFLIASIAAPVDAGLFFGPNTRIVQHHHYYGTAPAAIYSARPTVAVVGVRCAHPHKAAKHASKAAKHAALADHYGNN